MRRTIRSGGVTLIALVLLAGTAAIAQTTGGATLPSLKLVAGILGHAQLRTTEQYAHDTHEPVVQAA